MSACATWIATLWSSRRRRGIVLCAFWGRKEVSWCDKVYFCANRRKQKTVIFIWWPFIDLCVGISGLFNHVSLVKSHPRLKAHWSYKSSPLVSTRGAKQLQTTQTHNATQTDEKTPLASVLNLTLYLWVVVSSVVICTTGRRRFVCFRCWWSILGSREQDSRNTFMCDTDQQPPLVTVTLVKDVSCSAQQRPWNNIVIH